jgi:entericidin B
MLSTGVSGRGFSNDQGYTHMTSKLILAVLLASTVTLAACNTVRGAGRDVKSAGGAIEKSTN